MGINEENKCFVISPIEEEGTEDHGKFKDVLEYIIKPAIKDSKHNLEVLRSDEINRTGSLIRDILENIYNSFVVIADLTGQNPNVFYELGVRHSLKSRTILISQSIDDIPFDIRDYRTIIYNTSAKGAVIFRNKLDSYLQDIFENPNRPDNPVLDRLGDIIDHRITELEIENKKLLEDRRQDTEIRNTIKAISNPKKEKKGNKEYVEIRVNRILNILNIKEEYGFRNAPLYQGNFYKYTSKENKIIKKIYYISKRTGSSNYLSELADIRVLLKECSQLDIKTIFLMVTNEDFSTKKELIQEKFNKMKKFADITSSDHFSLEIWDNNKLNEEELELGIKI